jgi:tRNA A-37 threonylcarbamoyl transferase component Bud32/membrane-associated phospholipid phosphatase
MSAEAPPNPVATIKQTGRRRRPTGAKPPLPRDIGFSGKSWLIAAALMLIWLVVTYNSPWAKRASAQGDAMVLRQFARLRTDWLNDVMRAIDRVPSGWITSSVGLGLLVALIALRRWRHLFTFFVGLMVVALIGGEIIYEVFARPRPFDVTIIGRWGGFSMPAAPIAVATMFAIAITYSLVPAGRARQTAKIVTIATVSVFAFAAMYLGTLHPSDIAVGVGISTAVLVNAFRYFTPNDTFPVTYKRGKTAHLDVTGRRGEAIRRAVQDQLGLTVLDVRPIGLAGSGGSTPLLITVAGDPDTKLFGKLYAMSHVRADRWYKLGRMLVYGRLEDEAPYSSVRRLVQYEDYALRVMQDLGIHTAAPYGIVEMTPEREYMLVTEFFDGAVEIGDADIDDSVIDQGLRLVRQLWDNGLAHRDIKPANLLVRDGELVVIDVAFVQMRPSPWREAIDLANMMLVLAVRTDPERVYGRALQFFSEDEIAEAFAAARGIASPSQLRSALKSDGRDLLAQFRALAPARRPISLQRWSFRRVALAALLLLGAVFIGSQTWSLFSPTHDLGVYKIPSCGTSNTMILMAQAVPEATFVPCLDSLPAGWDLGGVFIREGEGSFWLHSDLAGSRAVEATLRPEGECSIDGATEVPSDEVGTRRYERPEALPPGLRTTRTYVFEGGCVTYEFDFDDDAPTDLLFDADRALAFQPRAELVERVDDETGLSLCGAGAPECVGGP